MCLHAGQQTHGQVLVSYSRDPAVAAMAPLSETPALIINLDRNPDRKTCVKATASAMGLASIEFVAACDGEDLS